ncbi:MAG: RNA polymerase sigma factor [Deltaproteobacteria bacterium]|nr:RNA polymerase sigma factor [Deltaproteobacteria bacterium]
MQQIPKSRRQQGSPANTGRVLELPVHKSDTALVSELLSGRDQARTAFFDRYGDEIERLLYRVLGPDQEIEDLLQDVFVAAFGSIKSLKKPDALRSWLRGIAVRKARKCILRRQRWRFIRFLPGSDLPEQEARVIPLEVSEALKATYTVLGKMQTDERVAFALRYIDGMELTEVAVACGVSLSTIKRRLYRAQRCFRQLASEHDVLVEWLDLVEGKP